MGGSEENNIAILGSFILSNKNYENGGVLFLNGKVQNVLFERLSVYKPVNSQYGGVIYSTANTSRINLEIYHSHFYEI